ncbi:MAG: ABC transporter permease, partial [Nitrospinota bacterium]
MTFLRYFVHRLIASVITLLGVSFIVFLMVRLLPGDPARVIAGLLASEEDVALIRVQLGLDKPLHVQYGIFLLRALQGDLGRSARTSDPVIKEIWARFPATLKLAVISTLLATLFGVAGGVIAATRPYSSFDYLVSVITLLGVSMPVY